MTTRRFNASILVALAASLTFAGCLSESSDSNVAQNLNPTPGGSTNQAPIISGNPQAAVKVGEPYSFTPTASDPDGDALTFSIENQPSWADFNSATGTLSGNPTMGNVGTFTNIRISVSDGQASASLSAFNVEVTQVALGSASLSWTAPTENEDGTPLTDLSGYKIYYGRASGSYTNEILIDNASVTTYLVENLTPDTYFFAATAFNSAGVESGFSGEAVKTVN